MDKQAFLSEDDNNYKYVLSYYHYPSRWLMHQLNEGNPITDIYYYIKNNNLTYDESILFLARMIYPSYYFDIYDEIIKERETEDKINLIINT